MTVPLPGREGDAVSAATFVFRIGKDHDLSPAAMGRRKALPIMFELSTEDKSATVPRLSLWVESLTIADQAWDFMGANPARTVVACLLVEDIHAIPPPPSFSQLRVEWEQVLVSQGNQARVPDMRPGAEGHVGIAGLDQGGSGNQDKNKRKALRSALADIAKISPVPVPHDIEDGHLQLAAFYISLNAQEQTGSPKGDWVKAVRQIRRSRVASAAPAVA